jgi:hypothetical protein
MFVTFRPVATYLCGGLLYAAAGDTALLCVPWYNRTMVCGLHKGQREMCMARWHYQPSSQTCGAAFDCCQWGRTASDQRKVAAAPDGASRASTTAGGVTRGRWAVSVYIPLLVCSCPCSQGSLDVLPAGNNA